MMAPILHHGVLVGRADPQDWQLTERMRDQFMGLERNLQRYLYHGMKYEIVKTAYSTSIISISTTARALANSNYSLQPWSTSLSL
jgi:hypothetical protein